MAEKNASAPMGLRPHGRRGRGAPAERAKDFKGSFSRLLRFLRPYVGRITAVAVLAALSTVFAIAGPKVLSLATDALTRGLAAMVGGTGGIDFAYIGRILLFCLGLYTASGCFSYAQSFIMAGVSAKVSFGLREALDKKINRLPLDYFHGTSQGDVLSRITNDVDTVSQNLHGTVTQMITSAVTFVGVLAMMFSISVPMTLIALCAIPLSAAGMAVIVKHSQKYFVRNQSNLGDVNGHVEEMYGGHIVVKAFNAEGCSVDEFKRRNDRLYDSAWRSQFLSSLMQPLMGFIGNLSYVVVCVAGASMTAAGTMTIGGIQAFVQYVRNLNQPITQIASISNQIQQTMAAAERVFEFLDETEESRPVATARVWHEGEPETDGAVKVEGNIRFEHVRFGYSPDEIVIEDFCADIRAGQKVAIVGPTGAGKTTLVKLLMHFHELNGGAIYLDGHNINEFDRTDLRSEFGMVLQDTWLFGGTIMDNLRYGRLDAKDSEVIAAAKAAQVDKFVRALPDGYGMVLNEEATNISQGQKQLMTIARAILENAKVLILDEATSSVDTRTEILIQRAMDNLMKGRTSFIIAHRLSTIRGADIILCINDGDIVEQGTHDELMEKGGFYAELYNSQFESTGA